MQAGPLLENVSRERERTSSSMFRKRLLHQTRAVLYSVAAFGLLGLVVSIRATIKVPLPNGDVVSMKTVGLKLPRKLLRYVFADGIGHVRQMAVAPDGIVYVNTWSGSASQLRSFISTAFSDAQSN
jgi:hypothetical protein